MKEVVKILVTQLKLQEEPAATSSKIQVLNSAIDFSIFNIMSVRKHFENTSLADADQVAS